jgi:hypothetical protein
LTAHGGTVRYAVTTAALTVYQEALIAGGWGMPPWRETLGG